MSTAYNTSNVPAEPRLDFGWISQAWTLFRQQTGAWVGAIFIYFVIIGLLAGVLVFSTGLYSYFQTLALAGPTATPAMNPRATLVRLLPLTLILVPLSTILLGGLYRMAIRQARGETITATDLFSALDAAVPLLLIGFAVAALGVAVGLLLPRFGSIINLFWQGLFMFAPLFAVDKRLSAPAAIVESFQLLKRQWLMTALFFFVLTLVSGIGGLLCGVGVFATYPLLFLTLAVGYMAFTEPGRPIGRLTDAQFDYGTAQPGVWPPPPTAAPPPPSWPPPPGTAGSA